jgi:beta-1,4-galactosyltransferase 4
MKYSIIIPYRNREDHLLTLLPRLQEVFKKKDYEIIISEQDNQDNFQIAIVENIGYLHSTGDIIVLHQVDYYPTEDVTYEFDGNVMLPARKGIFLNKGNQEVRPLSDVPAGYRNFYHEIDPNFYGGVIVLSKNQFEVINGLNPLYKGWGNEDEDLRERIKWANLPCKRNDVGTYYCLYHEDNGDMHNKDVQKQQDFLEGRQLYANAYKYRHIGYKNIEYTYQQVPTQFENVKWIRSTNYKIINNEKIKK